jgi:hypothetical protein
MQFKRFIGLPIAFVTWALAGVLTSSAAADHIILRNGRTLDGEVVREDDRALAVEIFASPYTFVRNVNKSQVREWQRPPHVGAPYVLIPIFGVIGNDVTVDALREGLAKAREANPRCIVLAIDSPGGDISQMNGMVDLLIDASKDVEIVAYVKQAYSAAAVIAMCCREVYMRPDAVIGACVPFQMAENGPADVDAKFRSAFEAKIRASTFHGGHADLLIRGMSEMDLKIFLVTENGKPVLRTAGPGRLIKSSGQILTLTTNEAVQCGLAHNTTSMEDLGNQVAGGPWYESSHRPWNAVVGTIELRRRHLAKEAAIARIRPEYNALERQIVPLLAKGVAVQNALNDLTAQCNSELQQVDFEYRQAVILAQYQADPNLATARAIEVRNARAAATRQAYQTNATAIYSGGDAALLEVAQLRNRQRQLLASVPAGG